MVYYPTKDMIADYSTKPTQGVLFVRQRNMIQGVSPQDTKMHKPSYERVMRKHDLWDREESDLGDLQSSR